MQVNWNTVTRLESRYPFTGSNDNPSILMAEDSRQIFIRDFFPGEAL
jgi:hypothetical protein